MYQLWFDGSCEPKNPGGYAIGSYVLRGPLEIHNRRNAKLICHGKGATNNLAEWHGLLLGLHDLHELIKGRCYHDFPLIVFGDSSLVIQQAMGLWECKAEHLKPLLKEARELLKPLTWGARWIPREANQEADEVGRELYRSLCRPKSA